MPILPKIPAGQSDVMPNGRLIDRSTEYWDAYCCSKKASHLVAAPPLMKEVWASYDRQPVGGRVQAKYKAEVERRRRETMQPAQMQQNCTRYLSPNGAMDSQFVAAVETQAQQGTHRVMPNWRDPLWSAPTRVDGKTLYKPSDRDPCSRNNLYTYRSTQVDAQKTGPCSHLPAPDVHKLRYMHNCYMTPDDWYM